MGQYQAIVIAVMPRLFVGGMAMFVIDACGGRYVCDSLPLIDTIAAFNYTRRAF